MASTPSGALLTETHRLTQARIGAMTKQQLESVWPTLDLDHLDASFPDWLAQVNGIVGAGHQISASTAGAYFTSFRQVELGAGTKPFRPVLASPVDSDALATSMRVTGPVAIKSAIGRGVDLLDAARIALAGSSDAGARHALSGGRDTISQSVAADPRALGWARVASGNACAFCAMLASRGPVYSEDSVDFEAHDKCDCSSEPVYSDDQEWPENSTDYRDLYNDVTADVPPGGDLLNAFRQALSARSAE